MYQDLTNRLIASAGRMIDYQDKLFEVFQRLGNDSKSRIVWLVAISGFAITNLPNLTSTSHQTQAQPLVPAAWVLTAILGVVTHWQFRNRSIAETQVYTTKRDLLLAYIANGPENATVTELDEIISNKKEPLPKLFKSQMSVTRFTDGLELTTMILFTISMALMIRSYFLP